MEQLRDFPSAVCEKVISNVKCRSSVERSLICDIFVAFPCLVVVVPSDKGPAYSGPIH